MTAGEAALVMGGNMARVASEVWRATRTRPIAGQASLDGGRPFPKRLGQVTVRVRVLDAKCPQLRRRRRPITGGIQRLDQRRPLRWRHL